MQASRILMDDCLAPNKCVQPTCAPRSAASMRMWMSGAAADVQGILRTWPYPVMKGEVLVVSTQRPAPGAAADAER